MRNKYLLSIVFFLVTVNGYAQEFSKYLIDYKLHYGFIISHSPTMHYITRNHFAINEISFAKQSAGKKLWQQKFHYPVYGVTVIQSTFSKNHFFGNTFGAASFINFKTITTPKLRSFFKLGLGLSYTQKVYQPEINYKNTALSTSLNALIMLHFNQSIKLSKQFQFTFGGGLTHYSNGNIKKPNRGINILTVNTGVTYLAGKQTAVSIRDSTIRKMFLFTARTAIGIKEIYPPLGNKYFASTIGAYINYQTSLKNTFGVGIDYFYDSSLLDELNKDVVVSYNPSLKNQLAVYGNYQLNISKLSIELGWGNYIINKFKLYGMFYQRIGLRYNFTSGIFANLTLKTHFANADYVEWGIGYTLKAKNK